jgi:hypothetical protein
MKEYRVEFLRKEIKSIAPIKKDAPVRENFLEERTGDTILAVFHAENDKKARQKAKELSRSLKTGKLAHARD